MTVALEAFIKQLTDSGVMTAEVLGEFIPPKAQPKDSQELAQQLIRSKRLTKYQAQEIYAGRGKSLNLSNYIILDTIGAGGMGQVFRAKHRQMHREVAIKMLPRSVNRDPDAVARFQREVRAAAKLRHANIVAADDADEANGTHFLVMEFVEGSDLSALVRKSGPVSIETAVDYILQAARGLEYAHKRGVIHRDIKPANLLLDTEGVVKVLDMGLARIDSAHEETTQADLTGTGTIMGTIDYMAPEQAINSKRADARSDIYSLGCSLYFLITGRPVYSGETVMEKMLAHREQDVPKLNPPQRNVTPQLEFVYEKMVAKQPDGRFQTMSEVVVVLEAVKREFSLPGTVNVAPTTLTDPRQNRGLVSVSPTVVAPQAENTGRGRTVELLLKFVGGMFATIIAPILVIYIQRYLESNEKLPEPKVAGADATVEKPSDQPNGEYSDESLRQLAQEIAALSPEQQVEAVVRKLKDLNQAYDEEETHQIQDGAVVELSLPADNITNLGPIRALERLKVLACMGSRLSDNIQCELSELTPLRGLRLSELHFAGNHVADLSPLKGMPLERLTCGITRVADLSPLKKMPLTYLSIWETHVSSLSPLSGMPLLNLNCGLTKVTDLSPLRGMRLDRLECMCTDVSDLSPLEKMPLTYLDISSTSVSNLSPLRGMPLKKLWCDKTKVTDLSPLEGMQLNVICFTLPNIRKGLPVIRQMTSLEEIHTGSETFSPSEFWAKYDAGEIPQSDTE